MNTAFHPLTLPQQFGYDSPVASCKDVTGFDSLNGAAKSRDTDNSERGFFMPESHTSVRPQQARRQFGGPDEEAERLAGAPSVCQPRSGCLPFDGGKAALQTVNGARAMSQNQLVTVAFNGQAILAVLVDGKPFVAMKPIIENIGLQWEAQYKRILRHPVLKGSMSMMDIQVDGDVQRRQYLCLPLSMLNGWLFGVDVNRVKEEIKPKLVQYQRECFDVLAKHFMPAQRPHNPAIDYDRISPAQAQDLKELVHSIVDAKVQGFGETWARLHKKFRVNSYLELPATRFNEARDYLLGKLPPEATAAQPGPVAVPTLMGRRWLIATTPDGQETVLPISHSAMVVSAEDLPARIEQGDFFASDLLLARIASAVALKQGHRAMFRERQLLSA